MQTVVLRITGFPFVRRLQIGLCGDPQLLNKLVLGIHLETFVLTSVDIKILLDT